MAVAHSAASESHTGATGSTNQTSFSWNHGNVGTPQGVLVFVHTISATNTVTSVTYGGVTLTRVTGGAAIDSAGEPGRTDLFFAGSGLGIGGQIITVNRTNNATIMYASAATVTAATDTNVTGIVLLEGDGTMAVQSVTDGGAPTNSLRYAGAYSGLVSPPPAGTGSTLLTSIDFGSYGCAMVRETTAGTGARNVGFNSATDDRAAVHVAVRELWDRTDTQTAGSFALTGNAAGLLHNPDIEAGTGAFTLTGNDATLSKTTAPKAITADRGEFTLTGNPADLRHNVQTTGERGQFFLPERNMRRWSESFDNAAWTKTNTSITANATTAPDGTLTADALIENTTPSVGHQVTQNITYVTGRTYTASCYFKLYPGPITRYARLQLGSATVFGGDTYININLAAGTITNVPGASATYGITSAGNGWYRAWLSAQYTGAGVTTGPAITIISTGGTSVYTDADGLSGIYIWGAQFEEGSLSDYDPTGPVAATRTDTRVARRIDGGTGSFALTSNPADTRHNVRIEGGTGSFSLTGNDATLTEATPKAIAADAGAFTLASNDAALRRNYTLGAAVGAFAAAGQPATLRHNPRIEATVGSFALNGGSPALLRGYYLSGGAGTFIETGQPATFSRTWTIQGGTGAFSLTGNPAGLTEVGAYEIDAIVGSFALSGQPATLAQSQTMPVDAGTFALDGQPATLRHNPAISAERGQLTLSGQPGTLKYGHALTAATGAFALTGQPASLGDTDVLDAAAGSFALTGNPAGLNKSSALGGGTGAFTLTGNPAGLSKQSAKQLTATAGSFTLTGNPATLSAQIPRQLTVTAGIFALTGATATFLRSKGITAEPGQFVLSGNEISPRLTRIFSVAPGTYLLTGAPAAFTYEQRRRVVLIF